MTIQLYNHLGEDITEKQRTRRMYAILDEKYTELEYTLANVKTQYQKRLGELQNELRQIREKEKQPMEAQIAKRVKDVNKYFAFFQKVESVLGNTEYARLFIGQTSSRDKIAQNKHIVDGTRFRGMDYLNPHDITPVLMKYFQPYYNAHHDRFMPLPFKVWGSKKYGSITSHITHYDHMIEKLRELFLPKDSIHLYLGDPQFGIRSVEEQIEIRNVQMSELSLMNIHSVRLLHETPEEYEYKILESILWHLEDIYVVYKQYQFMGLESVYIGLQNNTQDTM